MKVFKFYSGEIIRAFSAETKELAISEFEEQTGDLFTICEEIPKEEWDNKNIKVWEDNDFDNEFSELSINDLLLSNEPQMLFTNELSSF